VQWADFYRICKRTVLPKRSSLGYQIVLTKWATTSAVLFRDYRELLDPA